MIKVIDYGLGNVSAFLNVYRRQGIEAMAARSPEDLEEADKLILPGVGSFDHAIGLLTASGMREPLDELVLRRKVPVLGVCVGMQILAESSEEGRARGLGWIDGQVKGFKALNLPELMLPHMGWNDIAPKGGAQLFKGLESDSKFYFLHSYFFHCNRAGDIAATSRYGTEFCCAVAAGHIQGVQFHPEKSHHFGAQLLKNFADQ